MYLKMTKRKFELGNGGSLSATDTLPKLINQYNPNEIFNTVGPPMPIPLSTAFYDARYSPDSSGKVLNDPNFMSNTGAVQLFNINNNNPFTNPLRSVSEPYNELIEGRKTKTTWGHSERTGMRDILNQWMPENTGEGIERPMYAGRAREEVRGVQPLHVLKHLQDERNAGKYKQYLESKNAIVKMWSERPPCYQTGPGGNCNDFIPNIFPKGSQYGHIAEDASHTSISKASGQLKKAYEIYLTLQGVPPGAFDYAPQHQNMSGQSSLLEQPGALPQEIGLTNLISPLPTTSPLGTSSHHPYGPSPYSTSSSLPSSGAGGRSFSGYGNPFNPTPSGLGLSSSQQFSGGRGIGGYPELPGSMMMSGKIVAPPPKRINTGERRSSGFSTTSPTSSPLLSPIQSGRFFSPSPQGGMGGQPIAHYLPQRPVTPPPSNPNPPPQTSYTTPSDEAFWENYNPADWPD
jgi:hypothetical protein